MKANLAPGLMVMMVTLIAAPSTVTAAIPKPNVIYIMADELGYYEPGFMGGKNISTPNLPYTRPHGLFDIPDTDPAWALYKDREDWPEPARRYAAMVAMLDRQIVEIVGS